MKNDTDLYDISYKLDEALKVYSYSTNLTETPDGETVEKSVTWKFGEDSDNIDFRFQIAVCKNSTVKEQLKEDKEYEEKTIGTIAYTVRVPDEGKKAFEYITQHGKDVYIIRNNGKSGWFTTRSEESEEAFEKFLNTISFKDAK